VTADPLTLNRQAPPDPQQTVAHTLSLTAEERVRSRYPFTADSGEPLYLDLPRGTVLNHGDLLQGDHGQWVRVLAKPEPVLTVTAADPFLLLRAAYHLGNRHVPLEITPHYLRLSPDSVLRDLLHHLGLQVTTETAPFSPESGAYGSSSHAHSH
jgi:urease accessory protein